VENQPDPSAEALSVPQMEYDIREAGKQQLVVVQSPVLEDVVAALAALDQQSRTALTLIDGTGEYISVGGGRGQYHVYVGAFDHDDRVILQPPTPHSADAAGPVELVNDGSVHRYPARDVVDRDTATAALTEFHRSGRPHLDLNWRSA
jgi:hypothetical protein